MKAELRGLIFDFDGTIAETERFGQRVAYNRAFAELGLDWHWDEELYGDLLTVAGGQERLRYYLARYRSSLLNDAVASGLVAEIHRAKVRHFTSIAPTIPFRPGLLRLVKEAHAQGIVIAIATTASKAGVEALLDQDDVLPQLVTLIAANEAVERKKPAPDVYLWTLERLGLATESCIAIEDSNVGLRAALAAGLRAVITISDYTLEDDFSGASAVLTSLGECDVAAISVSGPEPVDGIVDVAFLRQLLPIAGY